MTANLQLIQFPDDLKWQFSTLRHWLLCESVLYRYSPLYPLPAEGTMPSENQKDFNIQVLDNPRLAALSIPNNFSGPNSMQRICSFTEFVEGVVLAGE